MCARLISERTSTSVTRLSPPKSDSPPAIRAPQKKVIDWDGAQQEQAQFQPRLRQAHAELQTAPTSPTPLNGPPRQEHPVEKYDRKGHLVS